MTRPSFQPPRVALALLARLVPADERDPIVGDLVESFENRIDAGRRFNTLWFWTQTVTFILMGRGSAFPRADLHQGRGSHMASQVMMSLRQAVRRLAFEWRYAAGVVAILAIGIGPASAMLSVLDNVLLKPLEYTAPERLGLVRIELGQLKNHPGLAMDEIVDLRGLRETFAGVEGETRAGESSLGSPDQLEPVTTVSMTPGMLSLLGVTPVYGRDFTESDVAEGAVPPVLLDYGFWQRHFGGSREAIGTHITIDGQSTEIIGVLPERFTLTTGRAVPQPFDLYRPFRLRASRNFWAYPTVVRLHDGVTVAQANARLDALAAALVKQYPKDYSDARVGFTVQPLLEDMVRDTRPALRAAMAGVLLLLAIAVANATALAVARLKTRERDLAVRGVLGAGRGALVLEVLAESAIVSLYAALAGSILAGAGVVGLRRIIPHSVPRWQQIAVGWDVVIFSTLFALVGLVVLGLLPVWKVARSTPWQALRGSTAQGGRAEGAMSRLILVGGQIALTVVLAFGAMQLIRSAVSLAHVDLGYDPSVLTVRVPVDPRRFQHMSDAIQMYHRVRDRVAQVNGVLSASAVSHLPFSGTALVDSYSRDLSKEPGWDSPVANYYAVIPGYFTAMKIPVLQGRDFSDLEDATSQHVVVIDETLARSAFPERQDVVGQQLQVGYAMGVCTIVGVVGHARGVEVGRAVRPQVYAPMGLLFRSPMNFVVRASGDPMALRAQIRSAIDETGPGGALAGFAMLSDNVSMATSTLRAVTGFVSVLAISAGVLSAVGLYIVIAFVVHQRRRSTAIRSALGASPAQLVWHHLKTSGFVVLIALPVGVGLAMGAAPLFSDLVYGVSPRDLTSLTAAGVLAVVTGLVGTYVPVRRAGSSNVVVALRGD
jgi:putative ABC transport system permease protein